MDITKLTQVYGNVRELLLPSGAVAIIREQNGDDDALLSNVAMTKSFEALNSFIHSITPYLSTSINPDKPPLLEDILIRPLRDKYFILIASRIFSLGNILHFEYNWGSEYPKVEYDEDLANYLWDYNIPFPGQGDPDYFAERIKPYPTTKLGIEETIGNKVIRFSLLNSYGEKYLLKLPDTERNINQQLFARDISVKQENGEWEKISSFKNFKSLEMAKLRNLVSTWDEEFSGLTTVDNPYTNGQSDEISIIQIPDFFFPKG